jgi:hypothetical protein
MAIYAMTEEHALTLAAQKPIGINNISLTAIDYNWGPPVSGRFDSDWMHIWACWAGEPDSGLLYLQATQWDNKWDINIPFRVVGTVAHRYLSPNIVTLFYLDVKSPYPSEFVLRLDHKEGYKLYDNNNNDNYMIPGRIGGRWRGLSALATKEAIWDFDTIVTCTPYWPDCAYGQGKSS